MAPVLPPVLVSTSNRRTLPVKEAALNRGLAGLPAWKGPRRSPSSATTTTFFVVADEGERLGPFQAGNPANPRFNAASFTGRVLRFEVETSTGGNTGAIEIYAYAPG